HSAVSRHPSRSSFFHATSSSVIYSLSLHDALPIYHSLVFSFFHTSSCLSCLPASLLLLSFFSIHSISFSFYLYVYVCVGIGRYGGPPPLQVGMSSISTMSVTTYCAYCVTQHHCPDVSRATT